MNISGMGSMSPQMMQQMQQKMFAKADADQSGAISLEEFGKAGPGQAGAAKGADAQKMFAKLDADGDGNLTQAEMKPPNGLSTGTMSGLLQMQTGNDEMLLQLFSDNKSAKDEARTPDAKASNDLSAQLLELLSNSSKDNKAANQAAVETEKAQVSYRQMQDAATYAELKFTQRAAVLA
jgi:hypothetical protein